MNKLNEVGLTYKPKKLNSEAITDSNKAFTILSGVYKEIDACISAKEYFVLLLLNRANEVIGYYKLSEGGISGTYVDIKIAFSVALKSLASGIIMCHNHPSGRLQPSEQDRQITKKFKEAGKLLEVSILDHLIISDSSYFSFADEGEF